MSEELTERQTEFLDRLGQLLGKYSDVVGPVDEASLPEAREDHLYEAKELAQGRPVRNAALSEFVILTSWVNMDDGGVYTSAYATPEMPMHHRIGLMMMWIDNWK